MREYTGDTLPTNRGLFLGQHVNPTRRAERHLVRATSARQVRRARKAIKREATHA